ncbi:MAG: helix-turn-helix transcriptional regulator [Phascolarctobacterium sp.]
MPQVRLIKDRLLYFYSLLSDGKVIHKEEEAEHFKCSTRSIERDIEDIRAFLHDQSEKTGYVQDLVFDRSVKGYRLQPAIKQVLSNEEVFAVLKILLESRAFTKQELNPILDKLIECCVPKENKRMVSDLIANEKYHYVEPRHKTNYLVPMWQLSTAVREHKLVRMEYRRVGDGKVVQRLLKPVGIMFSEFYFYLIGFIDKKQSQGLQFAVENDQFPTIYRMDRITNFAILPEHFHVPYQNRFEEGEFRKRVQFMYGGKLQKIKFWFHGDSVEAVLDRLPTARIIEQGEKGYLISAEVFGKGVDMWLRSQGDWVERVDA